MRPEARGHEAAECLPEQRTGRDPRSGRQRSARVPLRTGLVEQAGCITTIIALPLGNTPSTHIIKPEPERFPGLVATEILCMTLARAVGLNVPSVSTRSVGNKPCIVVQRYDRTINLDDTVTRVHQEDFCQALGFPPERKYQQEGGPLLRDCIAMLREWSTVAALNIRDFLAA